MKLRIASPRSKFWKWRLKNDRSKKVYEQRFDFSISENEAKAWISEKHDTTSRNLKVWNGWNEEPAEQAKEEIVIASRIREEATQWLLEVRYPSGRWKQIGMADKDALSRDLGELKQLMARKEKIDAGKDPVYKLR